MDKVLLLTFMLIADSRYPPCTPLRTDSCTDIRPQWPTLYIPCPPNTYCPPYDIPHTARGQRDLQRELEQERERRLGEPDE